MTDIDITTDIAQTARDMEIKSKKRNLIFLIYTFLASILIGGGYVFFGWDSWIAPLCLIIAILLPVFMWKFPKFILFLILFGSFLFEINPSSFSDEITGQIPFWWNVNTIFGVYFHSNPGVAPLNLFEVLIIMAGVMSCLRNVYFRSVNLKGGVLLIPMLAYMFFVLLGWVNGVATGGDFKTSLQEVRAQFYLFITYLMGLNLIKSEKDINILYWMTGIFIGIKGFVYTYRRYVTISGMTLPDQGVGSHEEAFFFDVYVVQLLLLMLCGLNPRLKRFMWLLLPLVILGNLATNRRAGTAAMVVAIPFLLLMSLRGLPKRRIAAGAISLVFLIFGPIYYVVFKNSDSAIAQPARAIKSHFEPDARDMASNLYRLAENANLMATVKQSAFTIFIGYGYGKKMLHVWPMQDISHIYIWWDILPHNQILWVWMRVGTFGFFAFWIMITSIILYCARIIASDKAPVYIKALAMNSGTITAMLMIFGLLDLQLSCFRDMVLVGIWVGATHALGREYIS